MKCRCCGKEMKKGYINNPRQPVQWIPEGKKPAFWNGQMAEDAIRLSAWYLPSFNGYNANAWLCENCQTITIPLKSDPE